MSNPGVGAPGSFDLTPQPQAYRMAPDRLALLLAGKLPGLMQGDPQQAPAEVPIIRNADFGRPVKLSDQQAPDPATDTAPETPAPSGNGTGQQLSDLPTPPKYAPPDGIDKPISPDDPRYKPSWARRLLGSLAAGAMAYGHQPGALQAGEAAINAPYNRAEGARESQLSAYNDEYQKSMGDFNNRLAMSREERERANEGSLATERNAKAAKYENAIDPNSIEQDQSGQWMGTTYGGKKVQTSQPKWFKGNQSDDKTPDGRTKLADQQGLKGDTRTRYILTGKMDKENTESPFQQVEAQIARMRLDDAKQGRVDKVMKDSDDELAKHKSGIQKRLDDLDEKGPDPSSPDYKSKMAQIERDDYQGMMRIGKSFSGRLKGYGVTVDVPKPQPWEQSNLSDDERNRILGTTSNQNQNASTSAPAPVQAGLGGPQKSARAAAPSSATPPASLLSKYKDGEMIVGKGGEKFVKQGNKWVPQQQ